MNRETYLAIDVKMFGKTIQSCLWNMQLTQRRSCLTLESNIKQSSIVFESRFLGHISGEESCQRRIAF